MTEKKTKSFLLMVDEVRAAQLSAIMPGIAYLEIEGMDLAEYKDKYKLLVHPIKPVVAEPQATLPEQPVVVQ